LTPYIENNLVSYLDLKGTEHAAVLLAAKDLGKSGTSQLGYDGYGDNPKYRGILGNECSEFVSWYYHQVGMSTSISSFKDIHFTGDLYKIFQNSNKAYYYDHSSKQFRHESTNAVYTPKAGDFLGRKKGDVFEHSMMLLSWSPSKQFARALQGSYIVDIREVYIQEEETSSDPNSYILGSVWGG
jgi:hypothetical protein